MKLPNFKKIFSKKNFIHHSSMSVHPARDWSMIVRTALVIAGLLICFSLYLAYSIAHDQIFQASPKTDNIPTINQKLLDSTLNTFSAKALKEQALLQSSPAVTDPSK